MEYRELKLEDFEEYNNLREMSLDIAPDAFLSTNEEERNGRKEKFSNTIKSEFNFVMGAFAEDKLVGIVTFLKEARKKINHKGGIYGMFVNPDYQGKGIGAKLLDLALNKAFKIDGIKQINLGVTSSNIGAVKLYQKAGFVTYGEEKDSFCVDGKFYDDIWMVKYKSSNL